MIIRGALDTLGGNNLKLCYFLFATLFLGKFNELLYFKKTRNLNRHYFKPLGVDPTSFGG